MMETVSWKVRLKKFILWLGEELFGWGCMAFVTLLVWSRQTDVEREAIKVILESRDYSLIFVIFCGLAVLSLIVWLLFDGIRKLLIVAYKLFIKK